MRLLGVQLFLCLILMPTSLWAFCFTQASEKYNVPENLLRAIAAHESSMNPKAISKKNSDGTYDIGLMQINSWWMPQLYKYGISQKSLLNNPCLNLHVGAWILATNFHTHGKSWNSVGAYNAGFKPSREPLRKTYVGYIKNQLKKLQEGTEPPISTPRLNEQLANAKSYGFGSVVFE